MPTLTTRLEISLAWNDRPPIPGESFLAVHRGGPDTLLQWFETQLGLPHVAAPWVLRVAAFREALANHVAPSFARSFEADPWATAAELLDRCDELHLAGWDGTTGAGAPALVDDLAAVRHAARGGDGDRLEAVLAALNAGQRLPPHRCVVHEGPDQWPLLWRRALDHLAVEVAGSEEPKAPACSTLRLAQSREPADAPRATDRSLRWLRSSSVTAAVEAVAAMLANAPDKLRSTVVCSPDAEVLERLDDALRRRGLPTGGASSVASNHPVMEALPLVVRLVWQPIDPAMAMALLNLRDGPVPASMARKLAAALVRMPGVGSRKWEEVRTEFSKLDPDGAAVARFKGIFHGPRLDRGEPVPPNLLANRCRLVADWAQARRAKTCDGEEQLAAALTAAAAQARALARVLDTLRDALSEGEIGRLLEMTADFAPRRASQPQLGGPVYAASPAGVEAGCRRLVWLGLSAGPLPHRRWTRDELAALYDAGLAVDDGSRRVGAALAADWRGLCRVKESVLAVDLVGPEPEAPHPVWSEIASSLYPEQPAVLEALLGAGHGDALEPWLLPISTIAVVQRPAPATEWTVPPGSIRERTTVSATELPKRIGCPLAWAFEYAAKLKKGSARAVPSELLISGTFLHQVLADVFKPGAVPRPDQAARRAEKAFNDRIGFDAAPLAMPSRAAVRAVLLRQVKRAAGVLAEILARGGYRVAGMEVEPGKDDRLLGRLAAGAMDCLVVREDGAEAVLDFKNSRNALYAKSIREGRSIQLATYAAMRWEKTRAWPAVAYLLLQSAALVTPSGGALAGATGAEVEEGPGAEATWQKVRSAMRAGDGWLTQGAQVPVRPLQALGERSAGADLAIEEPDSKRDRAQSAPCTYCNYKQLCGLKEPA